MNRTITNFYKDKNGNPILPNQDITFKLKDSVEPSGFNLYKTKVSDDGLGFWSRNENRVILFTELYNESTIYDAEVT